MSIEDYRCIYAAASGLHRGYIQRLLQAWPLAGVTSPAWFTWQNRRVLVSGSRIRTPLASDEEVGYMGCVCAWGVHALASNLEAGCTSKCMHFPQITRLACLLVLVLVTIEVQHRFGYLLILISPTVTFSKAVFNPGTSEILI